MTVDLHTVLDQYLAALSSGDRQAAIDVMIQALTSGAAPDVLIEEVIGGAQVEVGRRWQTGEWTISMEHRASGIAESTLSALTHTALAVPGALRPGAVGRAVVACSEGEWHVLPGRMVADVLRLHGIDSTFIGPSVPATDLAATLAADPPPVTAVTCSMPMSLVGSWRTISAARTLDTTIVCGGRGFGPDGRWAHRLGADHWAPTITDGVDAIVQALSEERPGARDGAVPDAPDEVERLTREREVIVDAVSAAALNLWGATAPSSRRLAQMRFDFGANVDVITAAMLVSDSSVLVEHAHWLIDLMTARGYSPRFVPTSLALTRDSIPNDLVATRRLIDRVLGDIGLEPAESVADLAP